MSTAPSSSQNDPNLSGLGRALLGTNEGSKPSAAWVPPTAEELHQILPQYEIVKMLGRGGMGAVYMGTQTALERPVAIKILSSALEDSDAGFTQRFKNEAKAMAKLNHPGIVSVYDFGEAPGGLLYIVMEYVDGTDVAKMIASKGRLHTEHAMAITAHVCDALAYAHERGIIHRDIKPANIMVGYDGEVKVADFGLAKVNVGGKTLGLTMSGMAMGTLHFMAPEALMLGTAVDHRADIYAVGVMLYQMLTGKLPQGMFKMPSLLVPGLDPRYDGIITKAIMEDREVRYQSAREMRADLDSILTQPVVKADPAAAQAPQPALPTQARPQRPGARPPQPIRAVPPAVQTSKKGLPLGLVATLVLLAGAAWFLFFKPQEPKTSVVAVEPSQTAITTKTAAPQSLAQIRLVTPDAVRVLKLEKDQPRLYDSNPLRVIEGVASGLNDWQFTSIPQRIDNEYTIQVEKSGVIYAFGAFRKGTTPQDSLGSDASRWIDAEGDITGAMVKFCYKRNVSAGEILKFKAFELQFAAPNITLEIAPASPLTPVATTTKVAPASTSTDAENWTSLFNGKDLSGWELHPSNFPADVFGGLIRIRGSDTIPVSGNMYYRGSGTTLPQWTDFELICTVMTENKGNSGIFLHSSPGVPDKNRANGVEVQIWNDLSSGSTGKSGSLQRAAPLQSSRFRDGEWFQVKTRVEGKRIQTWLKKPEETTWLPAIDWTQPADWAAYPDRPGLRLGSGTISMQNNPPLDGVVWFKEVKFRALDKSATQPAITTAPSVPATPAASVRVSIDNEGWTSLFNGKDLSGWQPSPKDMPVSVSAGMMRIRGVDTKPNSGLLYYLGSGRMPDQLPVLKDCEVQVTLKTLRQGNSGLRFHVQADSGWADRTDTLTVPGMEVQLWNEGVMSTFEKSYQTGSIFGVAPVPQASFKDDEWFVVRLRLEGQNVQVFLRRETDTGWRQVVNWTQPLDWTPPRGLPNTRLGVGTIAFSNWVPAEGETWIKEVKTRPLIPTVPPATTAASATTWIDTKGRVIQARFISLSGDQIALQTSAQKFTIPLSTLSAASQQIARDLQAASQTKTQIPADALSFGNSRYAYYDGTFTWQEAKAKAEALGGHLATITTAAEDAWVVSNFQSKIMPSRKQFWIGGIQDTPTQPWKWVTGETFAFTQWAPGEPNNAKGTDAKSKPPYMLGYLFQGGRMGWNDFSESQLNWRDIIVGYLVEWDGATPSSTGATATPPSSDDWLVGTWHQTNDGLSHPIYQLELKADHTASFAGGNLRTTGQWRLENEAVTVSWSNGARYRIDVPSNAPSTDLNGMIFDINGVVGKNTPLRMQKAVADFSPLFPNDSLSGWTGDTAAYRVSNGIVASSGRGQLVSPKEYGDFHLKFDLRIAAESNSGIGIWRDPTTNNTLNASRGFEVQILDDTASKYANLEKWQYHGGIYYFKTPQASAMGPVGSWNTHEIRMEGTQVKVIVNGRLVQDADVTRLSPLVTRAPRLDVSQRRGHLILLGNTGTVEFRNMQIKELP